MKPKVTVVFDDGGDAPHGVLYRAARLALILVVLFGVAMAVGVAFVAVG